MHRRAVFLFGMFITGVLLLRSSDVHAQTGTPPPLPWCPATVTPTSVIPTFVLPTYAFPTVGASSTPCVGGVCPMGTPSATLPATATYTPTITPSPSPTLQPTLIACGGTSDPVYLRNSQSAIDGAIGTCRAEGGHVLFDVFDSVGPGVASSVRGYFHFLVDLPAGTVLHYKWNVVSGTFGKNTTLWQNTTNYAEYRANIAVSQTLWSNKFAVAKDSNDVYFYEYSWTGNPTLTQVGVIQFSQMPGNTTEITYSNIIGTLEVSVDNYATPTPSPTVTPGLTPGANCQLGNPNEGSVDGGGTSFTPPVLVPGSCFVLVPQIDIEVPSIVDYVVPGNLPESIGIPGVQICTQYWVMNLSFFGFNIVNAISVVVGFVCVAIIYRTFQN